MFVHCNKTIVVIIIFLSKYFKCEFILSVSACIVLNFLLDVFYSSVHVNVISISLQSSNLYNEPTHFIVYIL